MGKHVGAGTWLAYAIQRAHRVNKRFQLWWQDFRPIWVVERKEFLKALLLKISWPRYEAWSGSDSLLKMHQSMMVRDLLSPHSVANTLVWDGGKTFWENKEHPCSDGFSEKAPILYFELDGVADYTKNRNL